MLLAKFVAVRLRELRARHDLTQEQVAVMLNADLRWYQRLELAAKDIRVSTVDRLADVFGLGVVEFLARECPQTKVQPPTPTAPHKPRKATRPKRAGFVAPGASPCGKLTQKATAARLSGG